MRVVYSWACAAEMLRKEWIKMSRKESAVPTGFSFLSPSFHPPPWGRLGRRSGCHGCASTSSTTGCWYYGPRQKSDNRHHPTNQWSDLMTFFPFHFVALNAWDTAQRFFKTSLDIEQKWFKTTDLSNNWFKTNDLSNKWFKTTDWSKKCFKITDLSNKWFKTIEISNKWFTTTEISNKWFKTKWFKTTEISNKWFKTTEISNKWFQTTEISNKH